MDIEMSLEDIIKKRKGQFRNNKKPPQAGKNNQPPQGGKNKKPLLINKNKVVDARNKIISKNRTKIADARDKLAELAKQKDARLKLEQIRQKKMVSTRVLGRNPAMVESHGIKRLTGFTDKIFADKTRQVKPKMRQINLRNQIQTSRNARMGGRNPMPENRHTETIEYLKPIIRTVENDMIAHRYDVYDEPMDDTYMQERGLRSARANRQTSLNLKIIAHNNEVRDKPIHTKSATISRGMYMDKEPSPPRLPSILKKRPMAALRSERVSERPEPVTEYRIIVSNLRNTVTSSDIQELFGEVGGMLESRLVRPGTAEVIYKTREDAHRAVELYHNRQLDGQPMNCLLVTPRASNPPTFKREGSKPSLPQSTNSNVEPDLSTFHKVLFSNF